MQTFETLKLPAPLAKALDSMGFLTPTPIQAQAIPPALEGRDLIACAQTGTGKTGAFGIPMVTSLIEAGPSNSPGPRALILVPTRELAQQVTDVLGALTRYTPQIKTVLVIGGTSMHQQVRALRGRPQIVIATPGRLCDHLQQRSISLQGVQTLVLDEADRMLDMGFAPQLNQILRQVPKTRQTLLFSATLPPEIERLAVEMLRNPARVAIGAVSKPVEKIQQSTVEASGKTKNEVLLDLVNARPGSIIIFARTKHRTDRVAKYLGQYSLPVARIHGDRTQGQRTRAMDGFRSGEFRILVATDIAARGLDISHIAHVINYDLPQVPEDYVHRIGRTARAGAEGEAVSILTPEDKEMWGRIQKLIGGKSGSKSAGPRANPQPQRPAAPGAARPAGPGNPRRRRRWGSRPGSGPRANSSERASGLQRQ